MMMIATTMTDMMTGTALEEGIVAVDDNMSPIPSVCGY